MTLPPLPPQPPVRVGGLPVNVPPAPVIKSVVLPEGQSFPEPVSPPVVAVDEQLDKPVSSPVEDIVEEVVDVPTVLNTSTGKDDGLNKCARCGSSEIRYDLKTGMLVCLFCQHSWNEANAEETYGLNTNIGDLKGTSVGSGAQTITDDSTVMTIKCQGCGAEIVLQITETMQARCHWCRQTLSVNTQIPNGAVPDALLPFTISHAEAVTELQTFVKGRTFFAQKKFINEFRPENVIGVYMPYMIVDANVSAELTGKGEVLTKKWESARMGSDSTETLYNANEFDVARKFDIHVDDLPLESSTERLNMDRKENTNNVINAIMPYDFKNSVTYNSNYLSGFTSEKRDLDVDGLNEHMVDGLLTIARAQATKAASGYDRGLRWTSETVDLHGSRWVAIYVPVWLYSSYEARSDGSFFTHHIAVNGRNKKTMGSIPLNRAKLFGMSALLTFLTFGPTALIVGATYLGGSY
jgi:ribosomal protein S27E